MRFLFALILCGGLLTLNHAAEKAEFAPLPKAFSSFGAATVDEFVYVYGGHSGKAHTYSKDSILGEFRRLNLKEPKAWEDLQGGPGLQGLAVVAHGGKVYRIGGMQPQNDVGEKALNVSQASVARYDIASKKWEEIAALPEPRSSHDAVVVGDKIYVFGGWKLNGADKQVWFEQGLMLDLSSQSLSWTPIKQPFARRALTMAAFEDKVYVIAGLNAEGEMELGVDIFDPKTAKWFSGPSIPGPVMNGFTPASAVLDGKLYLSGADGRVFQLSEKKDAWVVVGKLEEPRFVHRLVPAGKQLLAIGGASKKGNVSKTEAIEPACCGTPANQVEVKPGEQAFCPVMPSITVDAEARVIEHLGEKIKLCCATCEKKFKADPEAYLNLALLPQLKGKDVPTRKLEQVYCPVYRDRIVSEKDPFVMHEGVKIFVFNQSAVKKFENNPEAYLDPKLLPQLKRGRE
jgi:N-acetylneuraminic acid mutarotase/YHS domain-containing protein